MRRWFFFIVSSVSFTLFWLDKRAFDRKRREKRTSNVRIKLVNFDWFNWFGFWTNRQQNYISGHRLFYRFYGSFFLTKKRRPILTFYFNGRTASHTQREPLRPFNLADAWLLWLFFCVIARMCALTLWFVVFIRVRRQTAYLISAAAAAADSNLVENESTCFVKHEYKKCRQFSRCTLRK